MTYIEERNEAVRLLLADLAGRMLNEGPGTHSAYFNDLKLAHEMIRRIYG